MKFVHHETQVKSAAGQRIDLGLAILSCLIKPGECLTQADIAAWCGCTRSAIYQLEKKALHQIRIRLGDELLETFLDVLVRERLTAKSGAKS